MTIHVNIGEAKTRFSELCAAALRGEEVIVQKAGVPKLLLVPVEVARQRTRAERAARRKAAFGMFEAASPEYEFDAKALKAERGTSEDWPEDRYRRKFGTDS